MDHNGDFLIQWYEVVVALVSAALCVLIIELRSVFPRFCGRPHDLYAVQASHTCLTPRVGGLAIYGALGVSVILSPAHISAPYAKFILATGILFFVGLLEDLGYGVSPKGRLLAAAFASLVAIALLGVWLPRTGMPGLDLVMAYWAVGVPITLLVTAGMANGFNLIDGVNGLAGLTAMTAAVSLAVISREAGYETMMHLAMMVAASVLGFLLLNYPRGLIFLGDAGAYTLGFVLSWFGISILLNVPEASPWALLLTMFWPVADTLLAIYRRSRRGRDTMAPDRLHVHQMVMRGLEICVLGRGRRDIANPLTTLLLAPFVMAPPVAGVLLWDQALYSFVAFVAFLLLFFGSYMMAPRVIDAYRRKAGR